MSTKPLETDIRNYLDRQKEVVDAQLDECLPPTTTRPTAIHEAMRYSVFAGGKRIRPILALATGEALGGSPRPLIHLACALEMIHTYSLIHDDLPAMDNDDFRRGLPTVHRKFGEAIAILAGNGLLTLAFQVLAQIPTTDSSDGVRMQVIHRICRAVGTNGGLIGGQVADLLTEGQDFTRQQLEYIHSAKTGALLTACVDTAALLSGADQGDRQRLNRFGSQIGLAFQIIDDILDVEGSQQELGKRSGKDQEGQKATYPALCGLEESRNIAQELVESAEAELEFLGSRGEILRRLARFICHRRS